MQAVHPEGMWGLIFIQRLLASLLSTGYSRLPIISAGMGTFRGQLWASEWFPSVATFTLLKAFVQWTVLAPRPNQGTEWLEPILLLLEQTAHTHTAPSSHHASSGCSSCSWHVLIFGGKCLKYCDTKPCGLWSRCKAQPSLYQPGREADRLTNNFSPYIML